MSIATKFRIKGNSRIEEVKSKGKVLQSKNFGIVYTKSPERDVSRFAFVVSTKISKLAVHRNRIKRAMMETIRRETGRFPKGYDVVFLVKKSMATKTTEEIMAEVIKFVDSFKAQYK